MTLTGLRSAVAVALDTVEEVNDQAVTTHAGPVDAAQPPAYVLEWAEPWLRPASYCQSYAQLDVLVIAPRLEPEDQYATLEGMVAAAYVALAAVDLAPAGASAPYPLEVASVSYIGARLHVRQPVELNAPVPVAQRRFGN